MSKMNRMPSKQTICEVHRQLYDLVTLYVEDSDIRCDAQALVKEAFGMGVSLVKKLIEHKIGMLSWNRVEDRETIKRLRQQRIELEKGMLHE